MWSFSNILGFPKVAHFFILIYNLPFFSLAYIRLPNSLPFSPFQFHKSLDLPQMALQFIIPPDDPYANYNVTTNTFYLTFWQTGMPSTFLLIVIIRWAIAIIGCLFNCCLFSVILQNWVLLSSTCSFFIGINALMTAIFECSLTISLVMQLVGPKIITLKTCFLLQMVPIFCRNMIISTLFVIGIDRLICVNFVIWHLHHGQTCKYKAILLLACIIHAKSVVIYAGTMAAQMPELRLICLSSDDCYQGNGEQILFLVNTVILVLILLCYLLVWIFLRMRANNAEMESTKRIIKSLTLTATLISLGWLSYNAIQALLLPLLGNWLTPTTTAYFTFISSILPYIAMTMNAPLYYFFSKDYHNAFVKSFKCLKSISQLDSNLNQVGPMAVNVLRSSKNVVTLTPRQS